MIMKDAVFVYQMKELEAIKWHGRYHTHGTGEYELHYFVQGSCQFLYGDTLYNISPGTLFLTSPGVKHSIRVRDQASPITYYALLIQPGPEDEAVEDLLKEEIKRRPWYSIGVNYRFFFEEMRERGMSEKNNLQKAAVHQLISFLYILSEGEDPSFHREGNVHLEKALRIMQNSVAEDLELGDIARRLELSQAYFIRLFKRRMGTTPMKYYTRLKVEAAGAMLTSTNMTTAAIAERLKFYSEFHFSRIFKQYTGHPPSVYRKNFLQQLGDEGKMQKNDLTGGLD